MKVLILELNKVVETTEVNICGDSMGYDVFHKYGERWYHDVTVEILEESKKLKNVIYHLNELLKASYHIDFDITISIEDNHGENIHK